MKQEVPPKATAVSRSPAPPARSRVSRTEESPRSESASGASPGFKTRPRPAPPEPNHAQRSVSSLLLNRLKPGGGTDDVGSAKERGMEEPKMVGRPGTRPVEQFAGVRRRPDTNSGVSKNGKDGKAEQLQRRLEEGERQVQYLQSEVSALKAHVEKLQSRNLELESQNKQLVENLSVAQLKITALESTNQLIICSHVEKLQSRNLEVESQNKQLVENLSVAQLKITALESTNQVATTSQDVHPSEFRDVRNLIPSKLEHFRTTKEVVRKDGQSTALELGAEVVDLQLQSNVPMVKPFPLCSPLTGRPPPPPPPPPPRGAPLQKSSALLELYHSLTKRDGAKDSMGCATRGSPVANNAHNSIVGELQNRSAHLLAIRADVETKGDFIKHLIERVQSAAYRNMDEVLTFVDWLDMELSTLADERAVLKHFNWPERKADALREAAFEYRDLKQLELEVLAYEDDSSLSCDASLKKIESLLDKLERGIHRLVKLRGANLHSYKECKIPTEWMLDIGLISKMKLSSVKLAEVYIKRLSTEIELLRHSERESLLFHGVRFAYRAHQFSGGLDPRTVQAFEELREQVEAHGKKPKELILSTN